MSFSEENGYLPVDINTIMESFMGYINSQFGTAYTMDSFIGTNLYKYYYAIAQREQECETSTAEIFLKLQQYFLITNERISRPVNTNPGVVEKLMAEGYTVSVKPPNNTDAGKIFICVDVDDSADDYAATKLAINTIIKDSTSLGAVTQGTETSAIVLSNGQSFDFKYALPDRHRTYLKLTITTSENNMVAIGNPDDTKLKLYQNVQERYRLGLNFEPQKYFTLEDAPWASTIKLEYSSDNATWLTAVIDTDFDDLYECALLDITLVEN